jgi:hypothetical protein|tara:strand:+ start:3459 stop:4247 length:789 start_codon:yes stop_codon:yes gene_type:complete
MSSLLSGIGALVGNAILPGLGGSILGGALGGAAGGGNKKDILKGAAIGGLGSYVFPSAGGNNPLGSLFGLGNAADLDSADGSGNKGILGQLLANENNKTGNMLQLAGIASSLLGASKDRKKDPLQMMKDYDAYDMARYNETERELEGEGFFIDPVSQRVFSTQNELSRFLERKKAMGTPGYAVGGLIEGPGTGTSDDIPASIYQDGRPVEEVALSNGEVVLSLKDLENIGGGDAELAGRVVGGAPNGTRGQAAAAMLRGLYM